MGGLRIVCLLESQAQIVAAESWRRFSVRAVIVMFSGFIAYDLLFIYGVAFTTTPLSLLGFLTVVFTVILGIGIWKFYTKYEKLLMRFWPEEKALLRKTRQDKTFGLIVFPAIGLVTMTMLILL